MIYAKGVYFSLFSTRPQTKRRIGNKHVYRSCDNHIILCREEVVIFNVETLDLNNKPPTAVIAVVSARDFHNYCRLSPPPPLE